MSRPHIRLPSPPDLRLRAGRNGEEVFDPIRRRWVACTPEEWVRQHTAFLLHDRLRVPPGLIAVERGLMLDGTPRRFDLVAFGREGRPWLLGECKAPGVGVTRAAAEQAARYNRVLGAGYLLLTDGLTLHIWDAGRRPPVALHRFPTFPDTESHV